MKVVFTIPLNKDLIKECNRPGEHWTISRKRHLTQEFLINSYFNVKVQDDVPLPCSVKMVRIAPRKLDEEDNLRMAFKWIKDYLAARIIPGDLSGGMKDGDKRITWLYSQEKGKPREYAIRIEINKL